MTAGAADLGSASNSVSVVRFLIARPPIVFVGFRSLLARLPRRSSSSFELRWTAPAALLVHCLVQEEPARTPGPAGARREAPGSTPRSGKSLLRTPSPRSGSRPIYSPGDKPGGVEYPTAPVRPLEAPPLMPRLGGSRSCSACPSRR